MYSSDEQARLKRRVQIEAELDRCVSLLIRDYKPDKIILFGSMVHGDTCSSSDIDLVVVKSTEVRFLDRIETVLRLLQPRTGIDVLVYTPEEFEQLARERAFVRNEILGKGKLLYERTTGE